MSEHSKCLSTRRVQGGVCGWRENRGTTTKLIVGDVGNLGGGGLADCSDLWENGGGARHVPPHTAALGLGMGGAYIRTFPHYGVQTNYPASASVGDIKLFTRRDQKREWRVKCPSSRGPLLPRGHSSFPPCSCRRQLRVAQGTGGDHPDGSDNSM